jgi:tRNA (guanine10-N2)-dimethyltransferase
MMECIFLLSQENIELSSYEVESLLALKKHTVHKNILKTNINNLQLKKIHRLAYTKKAFLILKECTVDKLADSLLHFDFTKDYKNNFCLRIHSEKEKSKYSAEEYAKYIWRSLVAHSIRPKVNLDHPATLIEIFIEGKKSKEKATICKLLWENTEDFESRQAHLRPALHPTAMHPRLARALVNIVDASPIVDPFCGSAGIMIEAGLMKIKSKGYDIDQIQLNRAKINLHHYKINRRLYTLARKDATQIKKMDNIVTDLPYGKSSKKSDPLEKLYVQFVKKISGRAVVIFPDYVDFKSILKKNLNKKLRMKIVFSYYVHKSLTRKIVVIG